MALFKKKKVSDSTFININDASEESQTSENLDIPEDNDFDDDAEEISSSENDEFASTNAELFQFL